MVWVGSQEPGDNGEWEMAGCKGDGGREESGTANTWKRRSTADTAGRQFSLLTRCSAPPRVGRCRELRALHAAGDEATPEAKERRGVGLPNKQDAFGG